VAVALKCVMHRCWLERSRRIRFWFRRGERERKTFMKRLLFFVGVLVLAGCTPIASVKHSTPRFTSAETTPELVAAQGRLHEGQKLVHREPLRALGEYLAAAQAASLQLERNAGDTRARNLYNFAVARCVEVIEAAPLDPWSHSLSAPGPDGEFVVTTVRHAGPDRNPADYNIYPADSLAIGGSYFQKRVTIEGVGAPVVAVGKEKKTDFRKGFTSPRLYGTATAIIRFQGQRAQIEFLEPLASEQVTFAGHTSRLAADLSAPLAVAMTTEHPEKLGLSRFLQPGKYADTARLVRLQSYDPNRIPVIFVHGLQDTPASWAPMINTLRADPDIRRRYQFWVYSYPSGYPYPYSAALFRQELDAVSRAFPSRRGIVLIGHSMGGMVSRLMVTDVGDKIWRARFGKAPAETNLPGESKKLLEESLIFNHRPEVRRVVFISTPHRGSLLASNWIGKIATKLVRTPFVLASIPVQAIASAAADPTAVRFDRIPNSIDTLSPKNPFVLEINKFPITPGIPFHTIEGDRGRGDAPNSSDGVVPYWSSHLDGARSELVVPSNHSAQQNPQAIAEVERILRAHD
jgi:pimeloyl-ACP methyl ester carboxylesterase